MSTLPNTVIRLTPPSLRQGYCPSSWQEFANDLVCGTFAQHKLNRGTTFYNFGNQAPYPPPPTPEPPEPSCVDFEIDWEPASHELGENVEFNSAENVNGFDGVTDIVFEATTYDTGGFTFFDWVLDGVEGVETISFPNATSINQRLYINACPDLTTISMPLCVTLPIPRIEDCPALTSIDVSSWVPTNGQLLDFKNNALDQTTVDLVLARAVANAGYVSGTIRLQGGTNSPPSVAGAADVVTLTGRGVTVTTN